MRHLGALLLLVAGCGSSQGPCAQECPNISGVYAIVTSAVAGKCDFAPYELGPSLTLVQSENGRRVSAEIIDPANRLSVVLAGDVFAPRPGKDDSALIGVFSMSARISRAGDGGLTLDVGLSGSVREQAGRRSLSATLSTVGSRPGETACAVSIAITGEGS